MSAPFLFRRHSGEAFLTVILAKASLIVIPAKAGIHFAFVF